MDIDKRIGDISRLILSYCAARTSNHFDAEDMAQDILLELARSLPGLRDKKAFYGFMWSVAGNVSRQWYRKRYRRHECPLTENAFCAPDPAETLAEGSDFAMLRRELALLNARFRRATVMYYIEGRSCAEIANLMETSESTVKYLLFRSRQILREGMEMERTQGYLSYDPRNIKLLCWGGYRHTDFELSTRPISQNILLACYNDALSEEEISLEIGVGLPYMEQELKKLTEYGLVELSGRKYTTNIPLLTRDLNAEIQRSTHDLQRNLSEMARGRVIQLIPEVRNLGFHGADMCENSLRWQLAVKLLHRAIAEMLLGQAQLVRKNTRFGTDICVWAAEETDDMPGLGICNLNLPEGRIRFVDMPQNGQYAHNYFLQRENTAGVYLAIAAGRTAGFSETDMSIAADMVRAGYVRSISGRLVSNIPVFTAEQYAEYETIIDANAEEICESSRNIVAALTAIFREHFPRHLREYAPGIAHLAMLDAGIERPIEQMCRDGFLFRPEACDMHPTTHTVLV